MKSYLEFESNIKVLEEELEKLKDPFNKKEGISENIYRRIRKRNGIIINLDEEGAVDFKDNSTLKSRYSENMLSSVDSVFQSALTMLYQFQ